MSVLTAENLSVDFRAASGRCLRALDSVSLRLMEGQCLGIVGESGAGKSTLARALLRLIPNTQGEVQWLGRSVTQMKARRLAPLRRDVQFVAQDPRGGLDPRMTLFAAIRELLNIHEPSLSDAETKTRVHAAMDQVGLTLDLTHRYPHELSGGQAQRVGIARALVVRPRVLICDEPLSSLDVSVQAQIVELLLKLKRELKISLVFISHNLAVVRYLADQVIVLYLGRVMEHGRAEAIFNWPRHPYTRALLNSVCLPDPDRRRAREIALGEPASPFAPPAGCVFHTRCIHADARCGREVPNEEDQVRCHHWQKINMHVEL